MIAYDHALIVKNAQTNIDQTASALNYALTAMESLMALGFEHSHSSIDSVSSTVRAFGQKSPTLSPDPKPAMDRMLGLTKSMLKISGDYNLEMAKLFQAQLRDVSRSLSHVKSEKALVAIYGGEGAIAAVQEAVGAAAKAISRYQDIVSSQIPE